MAEKNIGFVVELNGSAEIRTVEGIIKVLSVGDKIHQGDLLTTGINTEILIEFYNGQRLPVAENAEVLLDESVYTNLEGYNDDRVDQLAELQQLIVDGFDLADLEAAAAGASQATLDALHSASVYVRDGEVGQVDTRVTPFSLDSSDQSDDVFGDEEVFLTGEGSENTPDTNVSTLSTPTPVSPYATISVNSITADDIINAFEATTLVNITGTVGGDAGAGDTINLIINGTTYVGTVDAGNNFSIPVDGADLATQNHFNATVTGNDAAGNSFIATTTSTHSIDLGPSNSNPDAIDDNVVANEDVGLDIDVLSNDDDLDNDDISVTSVTQGANGSVSINPDGTVNYTPIPDFNGTDSFTYTISDGQDGIDTATVNVVVNGINDIAVVSGDNQSVTEDAGALLTTGGLISITDTDIGEAFTRPQTNTVGTYGTFNIDANGNWTYEADNTQAAIQQLGATDSLTETFTVVSQDGSASNTVSVTITGTEDAPVITGSATGAVAEDGVLAATGTLSTIDVDAADTPTFTAQTGTAGSYGSFDVTAGGDWTYTLDNTAAQSLSGGEVVTETFSVSATTADGESVTQTVTVTVTGSEDAPVITGTSSGAVTDDGVLATTGTLVTSDADATDTPTFTAQTSTARKSVGYGNSAALDWPRTIEN